MKPIGILFEHSHWFLPLFAELERRGVPFRKLHVDDLVWDPDDASFPYSLLVNRMSPSAWRRGNGEATFAVLHYLEYVESIRAPVVNGLEAYRYEISKARQLRLLGDLGVAHPRARVISDPAQALAAAEGLRFPVLVKPNVGGSGAGIVSFETVTDLAEAVEVDDLGLGPDHTGLIQERLTAAEDAIVRLEILDGELLYGIQLDLEPGTFNLCPADYCRVDADGVSGRGSPVRRIDPPADLVATAKRIIREAGMQLGGVEYLVDENGDAYFYDLNALSNFVADAPTVLGFDPFVDLVDFLLHRVEAAAAA